jgi:hypothetical protein
LQGRGAYVGIHLPSMPIVTRCVNFNGRPGPCTCCASINDTLVWRHPPQPSPSTTHARAPRACQTGLGVACPQPGVPTQALHSRETRPMRPGLCGGPCSPCHAAHGTGQCLHAGPPTATWAPAAGAAQRTHHHRGHQASVRHPDRAQRPPLAVVSMWHHTLTCWQPTVNAHDGCWITADPCQGLFSPREGSR